jgi:hypothetical protein
VVLIAVRPRGGPPGAASIESDRAHAYDRVFWLAYLSNGVTTLANAMLVRYSDFIVQLGGEERQLGLIFGCGMAGSVAVRMVQGESNDRCGGGGVTELPHDSPRLRKLRSVRRLSSSSWSKRRRMASRCTKSSAGCSSNG